MMKKHTTLIALIQLLMAIWLNSIVLTGQAAEPCPPCSCPTPTGNDIFNLSICVDGAVSNVSATSISEIITQIDATQMSSRFSTYEDSVSAAIYHLDLRGLPITLGYSYGSTTLMFAVPSLGIAKVFEGGSRNASNDLFEEYIKNSGKDISKELLRVSPADPVAGNPASIETQMAEGDFKAATSPVYEGLPAGKSLSLDARFGSYSVGNLTQNVFTIPMSYTYTFSNYDRLIVRTPITYMELGGATAYRGNIGIAYRKALFPRWSLTPAIGYGITGSSDLGSPAQIVSGSLTSDLVLHQSDTLRISMGNMVGYYATLPISFGDYSVSYNLKNTIIRNGLLFSVPIQRRFWNRKFTIDLFATDTSFFGDALYSRNYQEFGITFGPARATEKQDVNQSSHPFGLGFKYMIGDGDIKGLELNFGYRF
jgi:hypothetical protein